jgi:DNA topoisomerase IB
MDPCGHLQATGIDGAGRKQYLYHERWRSHRDRLKFDSMLAFGQALPRLRRRVTRELSPAGRVGGRPRAQDCTRERVLACSVRLLDLGFFRIGSEDYAERNESYGLSTMRREHVSIRDGEIVFDFPAKSGQRRVQQITDRDAMAVIGALERRRTGSQLLAYRTAKGWEDLHADELNAYIKRHAGEDFTAKDFRTWNATVLAAVALAGVDVDRPGRAARERAVSEAMKTVAVYLGNTPAVCRSAYVDPRVIDRFHAGSTISTALREISSHTPDLADPRVRQRVEKAVLELLYDTGAAARRAA